MQIAVTTPTGNVGRHVVRALVRAGHRPVVLARDPARIDADLRQFIEPREIDQFDRATTVTATRGVDALYWVVPSVAGDDPLADYEKATTAVTAAVRENGIGRVVFQSSVGAERRHGAGEIDGLAASEVALDDTAADVTHLRCGFFFTNLLLQLDALAAGEVEVILPVDQPMPWVAPVDIAEVAAGLLLSDAWTGNRVQAVHGPENLSWADATRIVAEATGRSIRVRRISDGSMRDQLTSAGMSESFADAVMGMSTGLRDDFVPEQQRTALSTTPTHLGGWAYDELRPLLEKNT